MKKLIYIFFVAVIGLAACTKHPDQQALDGLSSTPVASRIAGGDYNYLQESLGYYHNEALDYAFDQIKENHLFLSVSSPDDIASVCKPLIAAYFQQVMTDHGSAVTYQQLTGLMDAIQSGAPAYSADLTVALESARAVMSDATLNAEQVAFQLDQVMSAYLPTISDATEQEAFIAYISVGVSTAAYWELNLQKWIDEYKIQKGQDVAMRTINGKDVGKSDAEGGASGALIGGATGTVLIGPVGTAAGIIVGAAEGAALSSLTNIFFQLFVW